MGLFGHNRFSAGKGKVDREKWTRAYIRELYTNIDCFPEWCEKCMFIVPKSGGRLIPFKLNPIQFWFYKSFLQQQYKDDKPIRVTILKARQMGFSTLIEAFTLWLTLGHPRWNSLIVAAEEDQAALVFEMTKRFFDEMPVKQKRLPVYYISSFSRDNVHFKKPDERVKKYKIDRNSWYEDLDSKIRIRSAEKKGSLGRAGTWHAVHATEVAFWKSQRESFGSLLSACHDEPHTLVAVETTANGLNEFYDMWTNRTVGKMDVPYDWANVFVPWYWDADYELPQQKYEKDFANTEEEVLYNRILDDEILWGELDSGLTDDRVWAKIYWRRFSIMSHKFQGDVELFNQEFPSTDIEAFRFSGQSVFNEKHLSRIASEIEEPKWRGNITVVGERKLDKDGWARYGTLLETHMQEFAYGRLKVYDEPQEHTKYAIAADIAEGKATEGLSNEDKSRYDFSCAQVYRINNKAQIRESGYLLRQVAVWHGSADPHLFGYTLVALAQWYGYAFLTWEVNGIGAALKGPILEHCRYKNIYLREDYDRIGRKPSQAPGWRTSGKTKPLLVAQMVMMIHGHELQIVDSSTLSEMRSFAQLGENKYGAARGHDDRVMSAGINCAVLEPRMAVMKREAELEEEESTRSTLNPFGDEFAGDGDRFGLLD